MFKTPCPVCGLQNVPDGELHDPFAEELLRHEIYARAGDNNNREIVRKLAHPDVRPEPCQRCAELIEAFDAVLAAHLLG